MDLKKKLVLFLKGVSMGLADIIPGVSGGTIALITRIYERLIFSIRSIDPKIPIYALKGEFETAKSSVSDIDLGFLVPLVLGIALSFLAASRVIRAALNTYPAFVNSFFFGLILSSAVFIYSRINRKGIEQVLAGILGIVSGLTVVSIQKIGLMHSAPMVFFSGLVAICAMILPGVSGAFILFILGQYDFMLGVLKSLELFYIVIFMAGAVVGLLSFSRVLSHLLEKYEFVTLSFLTGLMLGALKLPFREVIFVKSLNPGLTFLWSNTNIFLTALSGAIGIGLVIFLKEKGSV